MFLTSATYITDFFCLIASMELIYVTEVVF